MVPVLSRSREFSLFLDGTGTGTGKKWSRKKVPVPVSEKFGPRKKYRSRYRKKLVPEKEPVPVPEKIGPGKKYRSRYRKKMVPEKSTGPGTGKNSGYRHTLICVEKNCGDEKNLVTPVATIRKASLFLGGSAGPCARSLLPRDE